MLTVRFILMTIMLSLFGCGSSPEDPPDRTRFPQIVVVFAPGGLGDRCYNDCILNGVATFKKSYKDKVDIYVYPPSTLDEGERILSDWLMLPKSEVPSLMVMGSGDYMDIAAKQLAGKALTANKRLLIFESADTRGLPVTTFQISTYGASFLAGICVAESGRKPMVLLSNPNDLPIKSAGDGFEAGYRHSTGNDVDREYLADDWHGYLMSGEAYRKMDGWSANYGFIFPIAGGSNSGLYRYSREYPDKSPLLAGVDVDQSSLSNSIIGSVVKNIDLLLVEYLEQWLLTGALPESTVYGLESGYADWLLAPNHIEFYRPLIDAMRPEAVSQEKYYFEKSAPRN